MNMNLQIDRGVPVPAPRSSRYVSVAARLGREMQVGDRVIVPNKKLAQSLVHAIKQHSNGEFRALQRRMDDEKISVWKVKAVTDSDSRLAYSVSQ